MTSTPSIRRRAAPPRLLGTAIACTAFFLAAISWSPLLPGLFGMPFTLALLSSFIAFTALMLPAYSTLVMQLPFARNLLIPILNFQLLNMYTSKIDP